MDAFTLLAKLTLDSSEYDEKLEESKEKGSSFGSSIGTAFKVGGAAIAAVGGAALTLSGALVKGASSVASYGDDVDKASQKMGLSAKAYQEWDAVMQHSGTTMQSLRSGMVTLARAAENGSDAFDKLGMSQDEISKMSSEDLFSATITALQNVEDGTERTVLAQKLLGIGAKELGALLNTSAEDTQAMKDRVHELGGVMSDEAVKASASYKDSLQDLQTSISGIKNRMVVDFLPGITSVMDGLTEVFSGGEGMSKIDAGITMIVDRISAGIPRVVEVGSKIVTSLMSAIVKNLPVLLGAASQAILTISNGLISQLPEIVKSGLEVIISLANGIAESLPELIPTIVDVMLQIVDTLTDPTTLGNLVDASIAIIVGLANGLINALPVLLEKAPIIIQNLVTALVENIPKLIQAGIELVIGLAKGIIDNLPEIATAAANIIKTLLEGLAILWANMMEVGQNIVHGIGEGISGAWNWIKEKVTGFINNFIGVFKDLFGIHSPSSVTEGFGENLVQGLMNGLSEKWDALKSKISDIATSIKDGFMEKVNAAKQWGADLATNFGQGITNTLNTIKNAVSTAANTVKSFLGFSEPEEGPLSNFHTYAPDMMKLFAEGIADNEYLVTNQISKSFDFGEITSTVDHGSTTKSTSEPRRIVIEFAGDMASFVRELRPFIRDEDLRIGPEMVE